MKNFVVYKSSAGSGKTFTLVKEYLKLALSDEKNLTKNYKHILAVTFTNKAAAEMKERIISALHKISVDTSLPDIGKGVCEELKISNAELKKRAQVVLSHILHHYSDFSVGTIDSFTHKLVKAFAFDLKLPINFEVELDTKTFYETVVSTLINKIGEDPYISHLLKEYVLAKAEDNAGWDPEQHIKKFSGLLQQENADNYIQKLKQLNADDLEKIRKELLDFINYYKYTLKIVAQKTIDLVEKENLTADDFHGKSKSPLNFFKKCLINDINLTDIEDKTNLAKSINDNKWFAKHISHLNELSFQITANAIELVEFININFEWYSLCALISKQIYPLLLLKKIEEITQEKKYEEQIVFISEFNKTIFDLINNEPTPFIYERLGNKYHHFLLDEFQDTSSLQFQNLLPLLDNSLANGWFNLIVGDGKQSIYRWRNANVKQFSNLPKIENTLQSPIVEERAKTLNRNFDQKILNTNYRSVKTIIEFNNAFFENLSQTLLNDTTKPIYSQQAQNIKNTQLGYVTINTGKVDKELLDELNFNLITTYIQQGIQNKFEYKDICIIVRNNKDGNKVANFLTEQKIPVVSNDSLLLQSNLEVNTLICFLRYLANTNDTISAASILNYVLQTKGINQLQFNEALQQLTKNVSLFDILSSFNISINTNDYKLANLLDNCINFCNALNLTKNGYDYIRFFLDEVNEYLVTKNSNIISFLEWWEGKKNKASMVIPSTINAVKIMTIHASKGLEFPIVIMPYCNWMQYMANDSWVNITTTKTKLPVAVVNLSSKIKNAGLQTEFETEEQNQILDNLNLLYVAFTRTVSRLHIITHASVGNKKALVSDWIENYCKEHIKTETENFFKLGDVHVQPIEHITSNTPTYNLLPLQFKTHNEVVKIKASYLQNTIEAEDAKQQGIVVHTILSNIKSIIDVDTILSNEVLNGLITSEQLNNFKQKILAVIEHPLLTNFYLPTTTQKLEAQLITNNGELLRPDKLVFLKNETIIIDYKTGKENNKKYFTQLLKYKDALLSMGYQNIKMLLVYIDNLNVVQL